jgi:hypothetical protein
MPKLRIFDKKYKRYLSEFELEYFFIDSNGTLQYFGWREIIDMQTSRRVECRIKETLEQCQYIVEYATPYKDKNNKIIFAGDIVLDKTNEKPERFPDIKAVIKYGEHYTYQGNGKKIGFYLHVYAPQGILEINSFDPLYEIIGNVNENSEILKI